MFHNSVFHFRQRFKLALQISLLILQLKLLLKLRELAMSFAFLLQPVLVSRKQPSEWEAS